MRRALRYLLFWLISSLPIFFLLNALPGDASSSFINLQSGSEEADLVRKSLGLDEPWTLRYLKWVASFGLNQESIIYNRPVWEVLSGGVGRSIVIGGLASILSFLMGIALGMWAALMRAKKIIVWTQVAYGIPSFVLALVLIWMVPQAHSSLLLAAFSLAVGQGSLLAWAAYKESERILAQEYVFFALRRRSLPLYHILYRHVAPHVAVALLGIMSLQFAYLMSGAIIVEKPFGIPGLGTALLHALSMRDVPVLQTGIWLIVGVTLFSRYLSERIMVLLSHERSE